MTGPAALSHGRRQPTPVVDGTCQCHVSPAQDRIHRLGQYKPISVTRIVIAGTIEERILKLQEKKQLVFEGTIGQDHAALGKLTPEDLAFLFH